MRKPGSATLPSHETLARLARENPQSFETLRLELIENCVSSAPEAVQLRLRQLQFRIDGIRRRSGSPLGATLKIHALMWESFLKMNEELKEFVAQTRGPGVVGRLRSALLSESQDAINIRPGHSAAVLELQTRRPKPSSPGRL